MLCAFAWYIYFIDLNCLVSERSKIGTAVSSDPDRKQAIRIARTARTALLGYECSKSGTAVRAIRFFFVKNGPYLYLSINLTTSFD